MELLIYLLKASGCTAAFYMVYYIGFRKLTFFSLNRWYLLGTLVISLTIPLLHIGVQTLIPAPDVKPIFIDTVTKTIPDMPDPVVIQQTVAPIDWLHIATLTYLVIAGLLLLKLIISLGGIVYKAIKSGESENGYRLVSSANNSSFFKVIFLSVKGLDTHEKEQVIVHEMEHAKKLHSIDNLFIEVVKVVLWFNPFVYLFGKALCQAHEFEVDRCLISQYNSKNYAGLLLKLSSPGKAGLVNQFSAYGLKSRIGMLFGAQSAAVKKLGYLLVLPVTLALVYFLAVEKVYAYDVSNKNFVLVLDAGHGGKNGGARALNGMIEKDFNLVMVKQIKAIAEQRGIETILTRTDDSDVPFKDRLVPRGDIFVSVHGNGTSDKNSGLNGMSVFTYQNKNFEQSQRLAHAFIEEMKQLQGISMSSEVTTHRSAPFVLRENKTPAILLELGYLTNNADLKYLLNKQNQHDIAEKFVDAVIAYKNDLQTKTSGAVAVPDNGTRSKVKMSFITAVTSEPSAINNTQTLSAQNTGKTDTTKKPKLGLRYVASDSTRADNRNKTLYLYGKARVSSDNFELSANSIKVMIKDSLMTAKGNVRFYRTNSLHKDTTIFRADSLSMNLKGTNWKVWRAASVMLRVNRQQ